MRTSDDRATRVAAGAGVGLATALALVVAMAGGARAEGTSDAVAAERALAALVSGPSAADGGADGGAAPEEPTAAEARRALERARGARAAGDERHAALLEGLALELAESARDLQRTLAAEARASGLQLAAADAGAAVEHRRALVEETIGRRLRAERELSDRAQRAPGAKPAGSAAPRAKGRP